MEGVHASSTLEPPNVDQCVSEEPYVSDEPPRHDANATFFACGARAMGSALPLTVVIPRADHLRLADGTRFFCVGNAGQYFKQLLKPAAVPRE